ncbi:helix-turn-helix domain-containing protein [Brevundimonas sp. R86498]|uniref:helix-turn-helix domain-containing protein n=1 Tax=Brevundimonas sp. R86498 TaxID=3093845 RepID=UPI0037C80BF6
MTSTLHDANYRAFVTHLAALRTRLGVTQTDLAQRLGKPQSFVSKMERFERRIDPEEFRTIAVALGADPALEFTTVVSQIQRN